MPSIANRKRNTNQNHSEVSPHAHENGHRHKNRTLVRTWRSPVRRSWKAVWRFPPPNQHQDHCDTAVPLLGIRPKEFRAGSQREVCTAALAAALVTVSEARKQPARPFAGGRRMWHTRKATHRAALKKERSCRISDADEPRGRHTNEMSSPGLRRGQARAARRPGRIQSSRRHRDRAGWWLPRDAGGEGARPCLWGTASVSQDGKTNLLHKMID